MVRKKHTKIYLTAFGYDLSDPDQYVPCELTEGRGIDIHHIVSRENRIENLMMLTRLQHQEVGEIKSKTSDLLKVHRRHLEINGIPFDNEWFNKNIAKYEVYSND